MSKTSLLRVDKKFKDYIDEISKKNQLSHRESTRRLVDELTGESLFMKIKKKDEKKRNIFG